MKRVAAGLLAVLAVLALTLTVSASETEKSYLLSFAGDCTLGCTPENSYAQVGFVKTVGDDHGYPLKNVLPYLEEDDLTVVNLEGPLTEGGRRADKQFNFRGSPAYVNILTQGSVEAVSLANNHTYDYGPTGYASTVDTLEEAGVSYVEQESGTVISLPDGLNVGLYGTSGRYPSLETLKQAFADLRERGAQVIIFLPHWGKEYAYTPNGQQVQLAHDAIDAGAAIVCGSHPHVLQPIEYYGDGVIYYSLGNFCFGGNTSPRDYDTALIQQELRVDKRGRVTLGKTVPIPACISSTTGRNNYQPTPYEPETPEYDRVLEKLQGCS